MGIREDVPKNVDRKGNYLIVGCWVYLGRYRHQIRILQEELRAKSETAVGGARVHVRPVTREEGDKWRRGTKFGS